MDESFKMTYKLYYLNLEDDKLYYDFQENNRFF